MNEKVDFFLAESESDQPVLELQDAEPAEFRKAKPQNDARQGQYHLLAASALRLLTSGSQTLLTQGTYRLVADPKVGRTLLQGVKGAPGLYRGFTRTSGKIVRQAKFKPVKAASLATVALAALEIATIITSTVHLKEIGSQLKQVNQALDQIQGTLDDQRLGHLKGNLMYLHEVQVMLERGSVSSAHHALYAQQVETVYRECLSELHTAEEQLKRRKRELDQTEKVRVAGALFWRAVDGRGPSALNTLVEEFSVALGIALLAQETAVMACALGQALGHSPIQTEFRLDALKQLTESLKQDWNGYGEILKTKFDGAVEQDTKRKTLIQLTQLVQGHRERPKRLLTVIDNLRQGVEHGQRLEFLVQVDAGEVVDVRRLGQELLG